MRLYKAQYVEHPEEDFDDYSDLYDYNDVPEPEGWAEYAIERWGTDFSRPDWPHGHKPFFMPSDRKIYRSRSSAQARVDLINFWGGEAVLVECTPEWVPVEVANQRRKAGRVRERLARKQAEMAELVNELQELGAEEVA